MPLNYFAFPHPPQLVSVQRRKHDGPLQLGHLFRPHPDVCPRRPRPGLLPGSRQRTHQNHHHPPRHHLSRATGPAGPHLHHPRSRRWLLVRANVLFVGAGGDWRGAGSDLREESLYRTSGSTRISLLSVTGEIKAAPDHISRNTPQCTQWLRFFVFLSFPSNDKRWHNPLWLLSITEVLWTLKQQHF